MQEVYESTIRESIENWLIFPVLNKVAGIRAGAAPGGAAADVLMAADCTARRIFRKSQSSGTRRHEWIVPPSTLMIWPFT
jgi:hypothetical protein